MDAYVLGLLLRTPHVFSQLQHQALCYPLFVLLLILITIKGDRIVFPTGNILSFKSHHGIGVRPLLTDEMAGASGVVRSF